MHFSWSLLSDHLLLPVFRWSWSHLPFLAYVTGSLPLHQTSVYANRISFSNSIREVVLPSQLLHLGKPVMLSAIPKSLSSVPLWPSLSGREKTQRMFFPSHTEDPWVGLAQNTFYMGLWWLRQTQSCPVGQGLNEFRKSPGRNTRARLQREADTPWQWSGKLQEREKNYLGSPQPSSSVWRISLK